MTRNLAERNLLVGFLALQFNFISREQFLAGMSAWVADKSRPLVEVLQTQEAIGADIRPLLDGLVAQHLAQHDGDPQKSLATLSSAANIREGLVSLGDTEITSSVASLGKGIESDPFRTATFVPAPGEGSRFRILRPHAAGGLGEVFVAEDGEIHREVALKQIQLHLADDPDSRARFVREAEVTGGLEHPGIVPVYGLGTHANGRPYYAMRFIRGDSLAAAIERFHQPPAGGPTDRLYLRRGERMLDLRQLLGRFIDVCQAIAYAHSRGILHRDLKPSNIMLGKYGETLVVDWGLAKPLSDKETPSSGGFEAPLKPASDTGSAPTIMGSAIGTPPFMSPEQAAGRIDLLGPASDVFSLGATLYAVLTSQPPQTSRDRGEVLDRVTKGIFPKPCSLKRDIPAALEAICLKAMALKPEDRYSGAGTLAADLEHWLADEPVEALPESALVRARRWLRKRPALAASAAAAILVGLVGLGLGATLLGQKNQQLATTNISLQTARDQAIANEKKAIQNEKDAVAQRKEADRQAQRANEQTALARQREQDARWSAYVPAMNLAYQAWQTGYTGRAQQILDEQIPAADQPDLRGPEWYLLWDQCHQEEAILRGHARRVNHVAYSPDGKTLASASDDGTVVFWDVATRTVRHRITDHNAPVKKVVYAPSGDWLATGGLDGKVRIWNSTSLEKTRELDTGIRSTDRAVAFSMVISPNGKVIVVSGPGQLGNAGIRAWDTSSWRELWQDPEGPVGVAISPDSQVLVASDQRVRTRLLDLFDGREFAMYGAYNSGLVVSKDGAGIISVSASIDPPVVYDRRTGNREIFDFDSGIRFSAIDLTADGDFSVFAGGNALGGTRLEIWNLHAKKVVQRLSGHGTSVLTVDCSPIGNTFATGGEDATVRLWDASEWLAPIRGSNHSGGVLGASLSPNGELAATGSLDKTVHLWDVQTGERLEVLKMPERVFDVAFSPDGKSLAIACPSASGGLMLWTVANRSLRAVGTDEKPTSVAFSSDGELLACSTSTGALSLYDTKTWRPIISNHVINDGIYAVDFSPDCSLLAIGTLSGACAVLDARDLSITRTFTGHREQVRGVAFSHNGKWLATASNDCRVKMWDVASGTALATLVQPGDPVYMECNGVAFSPDDSQLFVAADGTQYSHQFECELRVVDTKTFKQTTKLTIARTQLWGFGVSADGTEAIVGMADGRAAFCSLTDLSVRQFLGERPDCYSAAVSPDGRTVAIGGYQTISWVDSRTHQVRRTTRAHPGNVRGVGFIDGGKLLVSIDDIKPPPPPPPPKPPAATTKPKAPTPKPPPSKPAPFSIIKVWDSATGEPVAEYPSSIGDPLLAVAPGGEQFAVAWSALQAGGGVGVIEFWDTKTWQPTKTTIPAFGGANRIGSLAYSSDGQMLAAGQAGYFGSAPCSIFLLRGTTPIAELKGHTSNVLSLTFLDDRKLLVSGSLDWTMRVWETRTGELIRTLDAGGSVTGLASIPNSDRLAVTLYGGTVQIWETRSWSKVGTIPGRHKYASSLAISPDGKSLVVTSADQLASRPGFEFLDFADPARISAWQAAGADAARQTAAAAASAEAAEEKRTARLQAAFEGDSIDEALYFLAIRLVRSDEFDLNDYERDQRAVVAAACDGEFPWQELAERLQKVETPAARTKRIGLEKAALFKEQRDALMAELLAEAKAQDAPATARQALATLDHLLRLDPKHAEAKALREKIAAYPIRKTITNSLGETLVELVPGRFWMGSPFTEEGRSLHEVLHPVRLTKSVYLAAHEVTRGQFAQFVKETGHQTEAETNPKKPEFKGRTWKAPGFVQEDSHPVVAISWHDAQAFCAWLSKKEGKTYRLPTEAEWEYACRAGTITAYPWGDLASGGEGEGNLAGQEAMTHVQDGATFAWTDQHEHTAPVGSYPANSWGLFDMVGNASEWCLDRDHEYPINLFEDPAETKGDAAPITRGASWVSTPRASRTATRMPLAADGISYAVGFRVVLESP